MASYQNRLTDPREYRRGMVLGLTLAETLILLTFLLLLTSSALTLRAEQRAQLAERKLNRVDAVLNPVLRALESGGHEVDLDQLVALLERGGQVPELSSQLADARRLQKVAETNAAEIGIRNSELTEQLSRLNSSRAEVDRRAAERDQMVGLLQIPQMGAVPSAANEPVARLRGIVSKALKLESQNTTLAGQNAEMRVEFQKLHGASGSGLPYCWPTLDGKPEHMLVLTIKDSSRSDQSSVVVSEVSPRPHPDAPEWGLVAGIPRGVAMGTAEFVDATSALRSRGEADRCLYAFLAIDSTGPSSKVAYKDFWGRMKEPRFHVDETHAH